MWPNNWRIFWLSHTPTYYSSNLIILLNCYIISIFLLNIPIACECNADGSQCQNCDENGKCLCKAHVVGNKCDTCATGFVTFPHCDTCDSEFFGYPDCKGKFGIKFRHWNFQKISKKVFISIDFFWEY